MASGLCCLPGAEITSRPQTRPDPVAAGLRQCEALMSGAPDTLFEVGAGEDDTLKGMVSGCRYFYYCYYFNILRELVDLS